MPDDLMKAYKIFKGFEDKLKYDSQKIEKLESVQSLIILMQWYITQKDMNGLF